MKNTIKKFNISGLSILELREKYKIGNGGFYPQSWYDNEAFAKDRPEPGVYEINFGEDTRNKTFEEQKANLEKGFEVAHPAIILEAVLQHYAETEEYLLKDYYVRTSLLAADGLRVSVGYCAAEGVGVDHWDDVHRGAYVGVGACRKSKKKLELGKLESVESSLLEPRLRAVEKELEALHKIITF
jgi:hypothetical protein